MANASSTRRVEDSIPIDVERRIVEMRVRVDDGW